MKMSKERRKVKRKQQNLAEESEKTVVVPDSKETLVVPVPINVTKVMGLFILPLW